MLIKFKKTVKPLFLALLVLNLQSCIHFNSRDNWPNSIPSQKFYMDYCKNNSQSCITDSDINDYLSWVQKFYLGSILYPTGWIEMTELVVASLETKTDKQYT